MYFLFPSGCIVLSGKGLIDMTIFEVPRVSIKGYTKGKDNNTEIHKQDPKARRIGGGNSCRHFLVHTAGGYGLRVRRG